MARAPARLLGNAGRVGGGAAIGPQCPAGGLWGLEPLHGLPVVPGTAASTGRRLPGVLAAGAWPLPGLARCPVAGRRLQPYGRRVATAGRGTGNDAVVAAEAVTEVKPHGHAVGAGQ